MKKIFISLLLLLVPLTVFADTGPKPSITITLKNMKSTNYKIDLLSDFTNHKDNIDNIVEYYSEYKNEPIYKYHEENMYATCLRDFLLHGSIEGNKNKTHTFTYFGVPDEFKVIVQMPDNSIRVSELITKKAFNYNITIDVNDMKVVSENKDLKVDIFKFIIVLLLTVIVELIIAILFKIKKYHIIVITNIITNSLLQILMFKFSGLLYLIIFEIIIFILEFLIYNKLINNVQTKKKLLYTICANMITFLLTFLV